jgi:DNA-binding NarL/FixJ family response regulator
VFSATNGFRTGVRGPRGIAQGKNNAAIAAGLFRTERAIEKRINAIFSKPGVSDGA